MPMRCWIKPAHCQFVWSGRRGSKRVPKGHLVINADWQTDGS